MSLAAVKWCRGWSVLGRYGACGLAPNPPMGSYSHHTWERPFQRLRVEGDMAEEHDHEHSFVEVVDSDVVFVYDQVPHQVLTVRFNDRGVSIELTYDEALALSEAMEQVARYVQEQED